MFSEYSNVHITCFLKSLKSVAFKFSNRLYMQVVGVSNGNEVN